MKGEVAYRSMSAAIPSLFTTPLNSQSGSAGISVEHHGGSTEVIVSRATVTLDGFAVHGSGTFQSSPDGRNLALNIEDTTIPLPSLEEQISAISLPERLKKSMDALTLTGGEVIINRIAISGSPEELSDSGFYRRPGRLTADIAIRNGAFGHQQLPYRAAGLSGRLTLTDGRLQLEGLNGKYGKSIIEEFNGVMDGESYHARLNGNFDGQEVTQTVRALSRGKLPPSFEKVDATGMATIDLTVSNSGEDGALTAFGGTAFLNEAGLRYSGFAPPIHSLTGTVTFDRDMLTLTGISGGVGNGTITLDGRIDHYRSKRAEPALTFSGILTDDVVRALWKAPLPDDFFIKGGVKFSGKAATRGKAITLDAHLNSKASALSLPPFLAKSWGFPLSADLLVASSDGALTIKRATVTAGNSSLSIGGTINKKRGSYSLTISSKKLRLDDLDMVLPQLEETFDSTGALSLDLEVTRSSSKSGRSITGKAQIEGGSFSTSFMARDISRLDGVVTFNGDRAKGRIEALHIGRSSLSGDMDITSISKRQATFNLTAPYLDLKDIASKKKREGKKSGASFLTTISGAGTLAVKEGQFFFLKVSSCDSRLLLTHERMHFSPVSCIIGDGRVSGEVDYFTANLPTLFSLSLNLENVEWETFLRDLGVKRKTLSGKVSGPLQLSGRRWVRPVTKGFDGNMVLTSSKGKLWRFKLVGTIFSIVNIISIDEALKSGLPYKRLSGDFELKDGIVTTESIIFNSDSMKASAVGSIDIVNGTIDTKLGVQPFVTIDKILTSIPLAGWIIGGDEKSSVKIYYDIKGSLKKPDVKPLPVQSIGKSVLGIFERVLVTPIRIVEPMVKPFASKKGKERSVAPTEPTPASHR